MKIDLLIKNAFVFMTYRQVFERKDIAIVAGSIYQVGANLDALKEHAQVVMDRPDSYIIPGLIDCHMHVESSMTYPAAFSKAALKFGTTTVVSDPHEMANVFGVAGIEAFMNQKTQMDIFYAVPSSVPATSPNIETAGAKIDAEDVARLLEHDQVICLGEVMNYADLIGPEDTLIKRIITTCKESPKNIKIEGHCPKLDPTQLAAFIRAGVDSDHTQQTPESLMEKTDAGMFLELQAKSLSRANIATLAHHNLYENIAMVTDDMMPDELIEGHVNLIGAKAVELGMPFEKAVYCTTLTPARRMNLDDRGIIAPGKVADLVILSTKDFRAPMEVIKSGILVNHHHEHDQDNSFPVAFSNTVHCLEATESHFVLEAGSACQTVDVNVMKLSPGGTFTKKTTQRLRVAGGKILWQEAGLSLAVLFERHGVNGNIAYALIENALSQDNRGAIATTWSHDSHNLLVLGNDASCMAQAQNRIVQIQGGFCVVNENEITAEVPLEIGGIVATQPIDQLAHQVKGLRFAIEQLGYHNQNVIMSVATLALTVSPELKLTDKGLFNVKTFEFEPLIIEEIEG